MPPRIEGTDHFLRDTVLNRGIPKRSPIRFHRLSIFRHNRQRQDSTLSSTRSTIRCSLRYKDSTGFSR